jgi:formylglycine-generating enzyme required for sulfatase activity
MIIEVAHLVTLTQSLYMQATKITQEQWELVMGTNPASFSTCGITCPVERVSWDDIQTFLSVLNNMGLGTYRLPTEAEWEYAARAGSTTAFANGDITETAPDNDPVLNAMDWYGYNSDDTTHSVAQKDPNAWDLYDMHGNVSEWVQDYFGDYPVVAVTPPTGPTEGSMRVDRSSDWMNSVELCRSARRVYTGPWNTSWMTGFRLVREP